MGISKESQKLLDRYIRKQKHKSEAECLKALADNDVLSMEQIGRIIGFSVDTLRSLFKQYKLIKALKKKSKKPKSKVRSKPNPIYEIHQRKYQCRHYDGCLSFHAINNTHGNFCKNCSQFQVGKIPHPDEQEIDRILKLWAAVFQKGELNGNK